MAQNDRLGITGFDVHLFLFSYFWSEAAAEKSLKSAREAGEAKKREKKKRAHSDLVFVCVCFPFAFPFACQVQGETNRGWVPQCSYLVGPFDQPPPPTCFVLLALGNPSVLQTCLRCFVFSLFFLGGGADRQMEDVFVALKPRGKGEASTQTDPFGRVSLSMEASGSTALAGPPQE